MTTPDERLRDTSRSLEIIKHAAGVEKAAVLGDSSYDAEYDALKTKWAVGQSTGLSVYNLDVENVNITITLGGGLLLVVMFEQEMIRKNNRVYIILYFLIIVLFFLNPIWGTKPIMHFFRKLIYQFLGFRNVPPIICRHHPSIQCCP